MGNLFRGWAPDAIAQIHSDLFTKADHTVCTTYYHLPDSSEFSLFRPWKIALLFKQMLCFAIGRRDTLGHWVRLENLLSWSRQLAPDVIYARPTNKPTFYWWLPQQLAKCLDIPYATHIMDDWPARYETKTGWRNNVFWKPLLRSSLQSLFEGAVVNLGISNEMCQAYQERYHSSYVPFHNCIEISNWSHVEKSYDANEEFQLVYLGAVTEDKELQSLVDIRNVVLSLREQGHGVRLLIYSASFWQDTIEKHLAHPPGVTYRGYVEPSDLPRVLSRADLLVLPINFDQRSLTYVGYSLQTKVPQYMASGTPVLLYAPASSPNTRYAARERWGMLVDQPDKAKLKEAIIKLMQEPSLRAKLGQRARALAFREHDAVQVRQRFRKVMSDVALGTYRKGESTNGV